MPTLFIGMPVYNGEKFLEKALKSLCEQTFRDWTLLISDNGSTDKTSKICQKFSKMDNRISYYKQEKNIGAISNFKFLLDQANTEFFMWAACDDEWEPEFIEACLRNLKNKPNYGLSFCNIINIDSFGRKIRSYPSFERLASTNDKSFDIVSYLLEPEILGKANIIYGIFRISICRAAWNMSPLANPQVDIWGADAIFNLATITLSDLVIEKRILFKKRIARDTDSLDLPADELPIESPTSGHFPQQVAQEYTDGTLNTLNGTKFKGIAAAIMKLRSQATYLENETDILVLTKTNHSLTMALEEFRLQNVDLNEKVTRLRKNLGYRAFSFVRNELRSLKLIK